MPERRCFLTLSALLLIEFCVLAVSPHSRSDWLLENALVFAIALALAVTYRRFRFSCTSYVLIFVFLSIHEIGAHYTYSEVPYNAMLKTLLGLDLDRLMGWPRNEFDRLVHLSYGLLFTVPLAEFCRRVVKPGRGWAWFFALTLVMATSMLYELIEWAAADLFGGGLGQAFLGTQGDSWDAQKDMALAVLGALITLVLVLPLQWVAAKRKG